MSQKRRLPRPAPVAALCTVAALTLGACGTGAPTHADGRPQVVASFYPLEFLARRIGGGHVHVTDLTAPGVEPHDLELTPRQVAAVETADLVVYLRNLQPGVDSAVAQENPHRAVDATRYAPLEDHHLVEDGTGDGTAPVRSRRDDPTGDPHIWLDPVRYAAVARGVGDRLARADPAHAADYRRNSAALAARLAALDRRFRTGLRHCRTKDFVTSHAAFGYLAERYGLRQIAVAGIDPESEPGPARLAAIQRQVRAHGVTTVFFEALASPRLARALAADLGLRTAVLDPIEGVRDPSREDYFTIMRHNLANLRSALGCTG